MLNDAQLLNHIYQTTEMGQDGILSVLQYTKNPDLTQALHHQYNEYKQLHQTSARMLKERGKSPKGLGMMVKASSQVMSTMQTMADHSASKIAEMMIQGNTMGVTKGLRTLHDYPATDERVTDIAHKLLEMEQNNIEQMKIFL